MYHFVTEMCTFLLQNGALWEMGKSTLWHWWDWSIDILSDSQLSIPVFMSYQTHYLRQYWYLIWEPTISSSIDILSDSSYLSSPHHQSPSITCLITTSLKLSLSYRIVMWQSENVISMFVKFSLQAILIMIIWIRNYSTNYIAILEWRPFYRWFMSWELKSCQNNLTLITISIIL